MACFHDNPIPASTCGHWRPSEKMSSEPLNATDKVNTCRWEASGLLRVAGGGLHLSGVKETLLCRRLLVSPENKLNNYCEKTDEIRSYGGPQTRSHHKSPNRKSDSIFVLCGSGGRSVACSCERRPAETTPASFFSHNKKTVTREDKFNDSHSLERLQGPLNVL